MPANALCRPPRPLPKVVDQLAFATTKLPRVSRHAPPVPDEGDQWPHSTVLLHDASSHPIGSDRSSGWLSFRRLEFALPRTLSVPEKNVDRELQWTKAPSIEGPSRGTARP